MGFAPDHIVAEVAYRREQLQRDADARRATREIRDGQAVNGHRGRRRGRRFAGILARRPEQA